MRAEKLQNTDIINDKRMNDEDLEAVSGGSNLETDVLRRSFRLPEFSEFNCFKLFGKIKSILKDEFNIRIEFEHDDIKNQYWDIKTGKALTHLDVMKKIRAKYPREGDSE